MGNLFLVILADQVGNLFLVALADQVGNLFLVALADQVATSSLFSVALADHLVVKPSPPPHQPLPHFPHQHNGPFLI